MKQSTQVNIAALFAVLVIIFGVVVFSLMVFLIIIKGI